MILMALVAITSGCFASAPRPPQFTAWAKSDSVVTGPDGKSTTVSVTRSPQALNFEAYKVQAGTAIRIAEARRRDLGCYTAGGCIPGGGWYSGEMYYPGSIGVVNVHPTNPWRPLPPCTNVSKEAGGCE